MGCFASKSKSLSINSDHLYRYPRLVKIFVKLRNLAGENVGTQIVSFNLTEPVLVTSKEIETSNQKLLVSSCILPGIDPRGEFKKKCQDNCFYLYDSESILCCLFDGHGAEGERVAEFCQKIIEKLFESQKPMLKVIINQEDPLKFIKYATQKCDHELAKKTTGIDSDYSGW
jgi:hypothetical protein